METPSPSGDISVLQSHREGICEEWWWGGGGGQCFTNAGWGTQFEFAQLG